MPPSDLTQVLQVPLQGARPLTPAKWRQVERYLEEWKVSVEDAARRHPARSYELGKAQVQAFLRLAGQIGTVSIPPETAGPSESTTHARYWSQQHTYHELDDALNAYTGRIKDAILNGLKGAQNPTLVASAMFKATRDADVNWRAIARTEMIRANAEGRLTATERAGYERVWVPPHVGACPKCKELLENRDFAIADVRGVTNYGRRQAEWVPCIPLHPHCRHSFLPYDEAIVDEARRHYARMQEAGFTDERLDEMFDSSGQLKPEHRGVDLSMFKGLDPFTFALSEAVAKRRDSRITIHDSRNVKKAAPDQATTVSRDSVPVEDVRTDLYQRAIDPDKVASMADRLDAGGRLDPIDVSLREDGTMWATGGQHRVAAHKIARRKMIDARVHRGLSWEQEAEMCRRDINPRDDLEPEEPPKVARVGKGFFDNPETGLDPLLWDSDRRLRRDVRNAILGWWRATLDTDAHEWSRLYITGGATSLQWEELGRPEPDPDIDVQIVVDYPALRRARKAWAKLTDPELHVALVLMVRASLDGVEAAPGLWLDAFVRPEQTVAEFEADAHLTGQGVWDVRNEAWLIPPTVPPSAELYGLPWLEGLGAQVALDHPDWLAAARDVDAALRATLTDFQTSTDAAHNDQLLDQLRAAYRFLHDKRAESFRAGGGGNAGMGNFLWQYLVNYGPLMEVKHLLQAQPLEKVWPDYAYSHTVTKAASGPSCPSVKCIHAGEVHGPFGTWHQLAGHLADHYRQGHQGVRMRAMVTQGQERDLHPHELNHLLMHTRRALGVEKSAEMSVEVSTANTLDTAKELAHVPVVRDFACRSCGHREHVQRAGGRRECLSCGALHTHTGQALTGPRYAGTRYPLMHAHKAGEDLDVAKAAKTPPHEVGIEHWITIHPNGGEEKGQPVLVRNNPDGTMSVIGGAGGHLNYLRLDRGRRMPDKGKGKASAAEAQEGPSALDKPVSEEEASRQAAERERLVTQARQVLERTKSRQAEAREHLQGFLGDTFGKSLTHAQLIDRQTGETVDWQERDPKEQQKIQRQIVQAALHTLSYGAIEDRDLNGALRPKPIGEPEPDAERKDEAPKTDEEREQEAEERAARPKRQKFVASMTPEQAKAIMESNERLRILGKQASAARKTIAGDAQAANAMALNWSDVDVPARVAERVAAEQRTGIARSLLETSERQHEKHGGKPKVLYERALRQGGYDALDAITHAATGASAVTPAVARLLGIGGTAQLLAIKLTQLGREGKLDVKKLDEAIDRITDERESAIGQRAVARARTAADMAVQMRQRRQETEQGASGKGEGLWTSTMTRSMETEKLNEAANALGMAIAGSEAAHALKLALRSPPKKITVGGFGSAATARELAAKARIKLHEGEITRNGPGDYSLRMDPDRLEHLFAPREDPEAELKDRLQRIRTGQDMDREIDEARFHTPGYHRPNGLSETQAKGSLFLQAAGNGVLAFEPGTGKTDTAIAAACSVMERKPGQRALVVAPTGALAAVWAKTIKQTTAKSCQIIGRRAPEEEAGKLTGSKMREQWDPSGSGSADFSIVSYETLRSRPELARQLGANIVIADEVQKAKQEQTLNFRGLNAAGEGAEHRWALTGTPIEKNTGELHAFLKWSRGGEEGIGSRKSYRDKFDKLGQYDQLTREEKLQQFRDGLSTGLFYQSAESAGNSLPPKNGSENGEMQLDGVPLTGPHEQAVREAVQSYEDLRVQAKETGSTIPAANFGGKAMIERALYQYEGADHALAKKVGDLVDKQGDVKFDGFKGHPDHNDGDHAGTYAPKTVVFGQAVKNLRRVKAELEQRGVKVFVGNGTEMDDKQNDSAIRDFLAEPGKAVFLTSDKNSTARSLQFGDNSGRFQHGATQLIHYQLPDNNATIQQREARIHRRGATAPVETHAVTANTPFELRQRDRLARERRTQELVGNAEQRVGGRHTMRQLLGDKSG